MPDLDPQLPWSHSDRRIDIAVVSANQVIRNDLALVLADIPDAEVRQRLNSVTALSAPPYSPAIAVVDLCTHPAARIDATYWALVDPSIQVITICRPDAPPDLPVALRGGVRAFLTRQSGLEELRHAITTVRAGGVHVCAELLPGLIKQTTAIPPEPRNVLAAREIETLQWLAAGLTHSQISDRMGLTEATVSTYVKRIRTKLQVGNKAELTRRAIELGYVTSRTT